MARKKTPQCNKHGGSERPHLGGLCEQHHEKGIVSQRQREGALALLHTNMVDGSITTNPEIFDEQSRVGEWWVRVCNTVNTNRRDSVLQDEAQYAVDWFIESAKSLVEEEQLFRFNLAREPPRIWWRLQLLRKWSHEQVEEIFC